MTRKELRTKWQARIKEFRKSGQSVPAWCKENNVKVHQLRYWLRKETQKQVESTTDKTCSWLPLDLNQSDTESTLTIHVGQASIEVRPGFDPQLLLDVVNTLQRQTC